MTHAESVGDAPCPSVMCRWRYDARGVPDYRSGIGEGVAGIAYAFDLFAVRTGDLSLRQYATAAAAYLESLITNDGAIPELPGESGYDTGFVHGAAGDAFVFLNFYKHTGDERWLNDAKRLLSWISVHAIHTHKGSAWPIEIDPIRGDDLTLATGIEEGAAGIGWVELQAYAVTKDVNYFNTARLAGDWLLAVADSHGNGVSWREDYKFGPTHTSLDNGAPGIGWFLEDLYRITKDVRYHQAALGAASWLNAIGHYDAAGVFLCENQSSGTPPQLPEEPSWHWGSAGIAGFLARLNGWQFDAPGEEPGIL